MIGVFLVWANVLAAQTAEDTVVLKIADIDYTESPELIDVCLSAENFNDVWSTSFTFDWNAGVFEFVEVSYMNPLVVFSLNTDLSPQGRLPALWYDSRVEGVSLDVQNRLMCVTFKVLRKPCNGESIQLVNEPTEITITDDSESMPLRLQPGQVVGSSCSK